MRARAFGRRGQVAVIGQGTWKMENDNRAEAIKALRRGLDLGMTHVDTAELYGSGEVEELVGEALEGRRSEVFLVSKVLPQHASFEGTLRACEKSLRRLRTDHLDCYLLHWPGSHPLPETLRAFERLQEEGKILSWGVSNFDVDDLEEARAVAGADRIACNQVLYHLDERGVEHRVLPWCVRHGVTLVAYSPFGAGRFPSERSERGRTLSEVARDRGATPRQIALAFLVRNPAVVAIPKASTVAHLVENAGAGDMVLTDREARLVDSAFPRGRAPGSLPTL